MESYKQDIKRFIEYFQSQADNIESVQPILFRKLLYSAILDPLARAAFGTSYNHHKKIICLLDEFTCWQENDRVSLPQLELSLREQGFQSTALYIEVQKRLHQWPHGQILRLTNSPLLTDLVTLADSIKETQVLDSARYAELFYTYRNNLIHEFREPGYGFELSNDGDSPYYHGMIDEPWQLVFPIGFFSKLVSDAITSLYKHLMAHNIDPYSKFEFGSLWRGR